MPATQVGNDSSNNYERILFVAVTLKDIANKAGVSIATVSRILNHDTSLSVSQKTRQSVLSLAEQLSYTKPHHRQAKATKRIAILQWYPQEQELNDLYYLSIRLAVERAAQQMGCETATTFANKWSQLPSQVDGLIAIGKFSPAQLTKLHNRYEHMVVIDQNTLTMGIDCVVPDIAGGIMQASQYLFKNYQHVGMIAGKEYTTDDQEVMDSRQQTFLAMAKQYAPESKNALEYGDYRTDSGYQAMAKLKQKFPELDAVLVANDAMALGALKWLHEKQVAVPQDVAMITFDDTVVTRFAYPPLSSIHVPTDQMAQKAVQLLVDRLTHPQDFPNCLLVATTLNLRQSTNK